MAGSWFSYLVVLAFFFILHVMNGSYSFFLMLLLWGMLPVAGVIACFPGGRRLRVTISLPGTLDKGQEGEGCVRVRNRSLFPVWKGEMILCWENQLTKESGEYRIPFGVLPMGQAQAFFQIRSLYCGVCSFRVSHAVVRDPFRLFSFRRRLDGAGSILILPTTGRISLEAVRKEAYDMESFRYSEEKAGDDTSETFDIREYTPGDNIRKIHWKLTGKMGSIMIRQSCYPVVHSVLLLLETGCRNEKKTAEKMDAAVSVYLSVAEMFLKQNRPCSIGFFDSVREKFCISTPETPEELWLLVPKLLQAWGSREEKSVWELYWINCGEQKFSQYIYVTDRKDHERTKFPEPDRIMILRCGDTFAHSEREICFTPENWEEELA